MDDVPDDTEIYRKIAREWYEEEFAKGKLKEARSMLLNFTESRFPPLMSLAKNCAKQISSIKVLEDLIIRVGTAKKIEDVLNYLLYWEDVYKDQL